MVDGGRHSSCTLARRHGGWRSKTGTRSFISKRRSKELNKKLSSSSIHNNSSKTERSKRLKPESNSFLSTGWTVDRKIIRVELHAYMRSSIVRATLPFRGQPSLARARVLTYLRIHPDSPPIPLVGFTYY
jgi:hypothetical protein